MSLLTIVNTALAIIIINFRVDGIEKIDWFPLLNGEYASFNAAWYKNVGSALVLTMITNILASSLGSLFFGCLGSTLRCCDRSCRCCNDKKTKQLTQENYETKNMGAHF